MSRDGNRNKRVSSQMLVLRPQHCVCMFVLSVVCVVSFLMLCVQCWEVGVHCSISTGTLISCLKK